MAIGLKNQKEDKEKYGNSTEKKRRFTFGDLVVPLMGLLILIVLTTFVYVPMLFTGDSSYVSMRAEMKEIKSKREQLETKLELMKPFIENGTIMSRDLSTVNTIIPNGLDVSDFAFYVDKLAKDEGLEFKEISSSDVSVNLNAETSADVSSRVSGVSGPIVYAGTYNEIVNFLDILQSKSPYIVETSSIYLQFEQPSESGKAEDDYWRLELNITGYYISATSTLDTSATSIYAPFIPYTNFEDALRVFEYKKGLINSVKEEKEDQENQSDSESSETTLTDEEGNTQTDTSDTSTESDSAN